MGYEIDSLKQQSKLPPLVREKNLRLPSLHRDKSEENSIGPKKEKLKEITKLYKINLSNLDDVTEKYAVVGKATKKERHSSMPKEYTRANNLLDYNVNKVRYRRGYDENYYNPKY